MFLLCSTLTLGDTGHFCPLFMESKASASWSEALAWAGGTDSFTWHLSSGLDSASVSIKRSVSVSWFPLGRTLGFWSGWCIKIGHPLKKEEMKNKNFLKKGRKSWRWERKSQLGRMGCSSLMALGKSGRYPGTSSMPGGHSFSVWSPPSPDLFLASKERVAPRMLHRPGPEQSCISWCLL